MVGATEDHGASNSGFSLGEVETEGVAGDETLLDHQIEDWRQVEYRDGLPCETENTIELGGNEVPRQSGHLSEVDALDVEACEVDGAALVLDPARDAAYTRELAGADPGAVLVEGDHGAGGARVRVLVEDDGELAGTAGCNRRSCSVVGAEVIVSLMDLLLMGQVTWDYLLTGLVAAGVVAPLSLFLMHRLLDELATRRQAFLAQSVNTAEARLQVAMDASDEGILMVAEDGHVLSANQRFFEMWHVPPALATRGEDHALLGHVLDQLTDPDSFIAGVAVRSRQR